ncbi:translocation/assembly module TamB domain-containing protein [Flavobacterium sp. NG2]|uniref:translocation/assembly module TamB domain-containing protein n=1 Tax=Flavobacterium sp. NG2 TaxID=3097547 RepID=UPI002A7EBB7E|nr:translocation/assembly module TamB domain-containing protein [Flavobacterium sp. NG2]WPR72814.1 translocation/assembly module TamB domain-containing protein [Flavobacterium sp. NG2]
MNSKLTSYFKKILRVLFWSALTIVALLLLLIGLIQVPAVQNFAKDKAITFLNNKIKTKSSLDKIAISFPKNIVLEGFYFEDQKKDTLLAGKRLEVDIDLFKILNNQIEINSVALEGVTASISRDKDSIFNFDYIIKAFESPDPKDPNSKPYVISVVDVDLKNIRFNFKDAVSKNDIRFNLEHFNTEFKAFDLNKMNFDIPTIELSGANLILNQDSLDKVKDMVVTKKVEDKTSTTDLSLKLNKIKLSKITVLYDDKEGKLKTSLNLGDLKALINEFDLKKQLVDLDSFEVHNLKGNLVLGKKDKKQSSVADATTTNSNNWKVRLKNLDLENIAFKFDDMQSKPIAKGMDYSHLDLTNLNAKATKIKYSRDTISGGIQSLTVNEKSGLAIQRLETEFFHGSKQAYLTGLYLKSPQTLLKNKIKLAYASVDNLSKKIGETTIDAHLEKSKIGFKDILLFAPDLQKNEPFLSNPNAVLSIHSQIKGKVNNLTIPYFQLQGFGETKLDISGKIKGLPEFEKSSFDLNIKDLTTTSKDINALVPKGTLPKTIHLPKQLAAKGTFNGTVNNFKTKLALNSSYGKADIDALLDQRIKNKERYDAKVAFDNFDLGKLIQNDSIGKITVNGTAKGTGFDPKTANAQLKVLLKKASFNKYNYTNINLDSEIANGDFKLKSKSDDPNLKYQLAAEGGFDGKYPSVNLKLNLDIADLEKLNLHAGTFKLRGTIAGNITNSNPDQLNGKVIGSNIQILKAAEPMILDNVEIIAFANAQKNNITVKSPFLKAEIDGKYQLTTLADAIQHSISKYIDVQGVKKTKPSNQQLTFKVDVQNDPILYELIPGLTGLETITITGKYNSQGDSLAIKGTIPRIVYADNTFANGVIHVETVENALDYTLSIGTVENSEFKLATTTLSGKAKDNKLDYALQIQDNAQKEQYYIAGDLSSAEGKNSVKLDVDKLKLNYDSWKVHPENKIVFGNNSLYINKMELSNASDMLKVQSKSTQDNAPLDVQFSNFKIGTLLSMVKKESLLMDGVINGTATIENVMTKPTFVSDLTVADFSFKGDTVGDISLKVNNQTANMLSADVALTGEGNDATIKGKYTIDKGNFDLDLAIQKLNVKSVQGFSMGNIKEGKGTLSGQFKITGTTAAPKVNGELFFNDAGFRITKLNSFFEIKDQKITLANETIAFDNFTVYDENKNALNLNGKMVTPDFRAYTFDLRLKADDFRAINSKAADNNMFYGDLFLDTQLKIGGTLDNPVVSGDVRINEDTKFTIVIPQSDPSIVDREGIVEFVDEDNMYLKQTAKLQDELNQSGVLGMDVGVAITIDKEAEFTMIIDQGNGDYLSLKGEAELFGGIDPSGKTTLTGSYEFDGGSYQMNFNNIKRKFDIQKGSSIVWNGEPTLANVNITAIYKVSAAPLDLLGDQLGAVTDGVRNTYKQKIPFQTLLKMKGELMKPEISFDIVLPDGNYDVSADIVTASQNKLEQLRKEPSALNKQVFALLLLGRFIGENPFASESGGTSAESIARQSVSKILSQQLNDLASDLISGVELSFDLESTEDYTSGVKENRTDLNVGVSKKLLDDRLKVSVGSNFGLEGQERANETASNIAGNASIEYLLSKDGRYKLRAYRKNEYQVAIQGEVVETGVAFIITMEYNKFRELFQKSKEEIDIANRKKREKEKKELEKKNENDK